MPDREKVIAGLTMCAGTNVPIIDDMDVCILDCPYRDKSNGCVDKLMFDALTLLKEQEAVLAYWDDDIEHWIEGDRDGIDPHTRTTGEMIDTFRCSWCGFYQYWKTPFCPNCGAKMEGSVKCDERT